MRGRLGFDAGALRDGLGRRDDGVRFCVGLGPRKDRVGSLVGVRLCPEGGTYVAGLCFDAGNGEDTLLLLDLVAIFPIDIL